MTVLRHILSILLLPVTVTLVVPYVLLSLRPFSSLSLAAAFPGAGVILCGLALVFVTIRYFATLGRGTLAPWDPPKHLVVAGVYRHVRNPMISGVMPILFGEALGLRSVPLLEWALGFLALNMTYIPLLEEPMLEGRFGDEYRQYKRHVPRWVPRRTAWVPPWA
ncbi:MAG: isoprenylcysteine carboxylmethyltransferase family protein [Acidobacteria bacterium]|nr:MAG: isoprenylcysteine carboxylmethyltransferase family protein [Acidobacteriota bacterium]